MGDPKGFLKIGRKPTPKRTVEERVQDYRYVYEPISEEEREARRLSQKPRSARAADLDSQRRTE